MDSETSDFRFLPVPEMESRIARFEERVNAAQKANPPKKEWARAALHGKGDGRCPVRLKRLSFDMILKYGDALADLFCAYPDDVIAIIPYDITIGYQSPEKKPRINTVEALMRDMKWLDEWGTQWGHAFGGVGATPVDYPLKDWSALDDYLEHKVPDPNAAGRLDAAASALTPHKDAKYCYGVTHLAMFERLHALRGMENVFTDFYMHEQEVRKLLDRLESYLLAIVRQWGALGADAVFFTDDWGSQSGLMISPDLWRSFFKAYYARIFDEVHRLGMDVFFHSCGNVTAIVGELIDVQMDVLDPVQPGAMDIGQLAREFGGKVAFSGAVDVQGLLALGTPQQVKDDVRIIAATLGKPFGGALVLGPANVMTPDIPFENLVALFEAAHGQE
jgi:uroporphyrinogen decarboxylase